MIVQPDRIVASIAAEILAALRAEPDLLQEVFGDLEADERDEIETFFGGQHVPVRLGYPRGPADLPGVYVSLGASPETVQPVGMAFPDEDIGASILEERGVFFQSSVHLACWTMNANLSAWLAAVMVWGLLRSRGEMNDLGLLDQKLTMTDLEPLPQWFPDFAFRRDVVLTAQHVTTFRVAVPKVAEIEVTGRAAEAPEESVTYVARRR